MAATLDQSLLEPGSDPEPLHHLLRIGEVIFIDRKPKGLPWLASAGMIADAPPSMVFEAVTDFNRYPEFMPQTEGARIKEIAPDLYDVEFDIVVRIVYIPITTISAVYQYNRPPLRTDWVSKDEKLLINSGYWQFIPVDQGKRTMAFYTLYTKINQGIAKQILELDPALESMADMSAATLVVRAMKERADMLYRDSGAAPLPPASPLNKSVLQALTQNSAALKPLIARGRLLVLEEKDGEVWTDVAAVFDSPPQEVWKWLVRVEDQYVGDPRIQAQVLNRTDKQMAVKFHWEINLLLTFSADYTLNYEMDPPYHMTWTQGPDGSIRGMKGSWDLIPLDNGTRTLAVFRATYDLRSLGLIMRALLAIEPTFELAIQASQNLLVVDNIADCLTLSPEKRRRMVEDRKKKLEQVKDLPLPDKDKPQR